MSKIKFGIVGFGHIGKRHAAMIQGNKNAELIGIADTNATLSALIEKEYETPFFDSLDEMLAAEPGIQVLNICTPNGLHTEHALAGLKSGCHVVCEKPMGLSKANCEQVIFEALHRSLQVFIVMQNRYSPPALWLKSLIENKILGEIFMVQINCFWNRDEKYYAKSEWKGTKNLDGGPLFTQFSHFIDIMYWLFGDIANIQARFENFKHQGNTEFEDSGYISFDFHTGGMGCLNYSTAIALSNFESSMTIIGSRGTVKVGGQYMDKIEYCNIEMHEKPELPPSNPPNDYGDYKGSAANHHFVIQNVIEVAQGRSKITTNALEGMKVVEIIERIYEHRK